MTRLSGLCLAVTLWLASAGVASGEEPRPAGADAELPYETTEGDKRNQPVVVFGPDEGMRIRSSDGNWKLIIGLLAGIKYEPVFEPSGTDWARFPLAYVRPRLAGTVLRPWIRFLVLMELAQSPPYLLKAFIDITRWKWFSVRMGLQYTPLSRHESFVPHQLLFPDFAIVANYFGTGFDRGVTFYGKGDRIAWYTGLYSATPARQFTSIPGNFVAIGRLTINPLGSVLDNEIPYVTADGPLPFRFGFTIQGAYGKTAITADNLNPSSGLVVATPTGVEERAATAAADFVFQAGPIAFVSEFYFRHFEPVGVVTPPFNQLGAWAQLGYVFYKRALVAGVRFNWLDPSLSLANDQMITGEGMLGWWLYRLNLSLRLRYQIGHQQDPGPPPPGDPEFFRFVVLPLERGTSQLVTLQATLFF